VFEFLFENIFVLIPVAIFIGLRVVEARRKREAEEERQRRIKEAVYERDDDDEEEYSVSREEDEDDNKETTPPFPSAALAAPIPAAPEPAAPFAAAFVVPPLTETAGPISGGEPRPIRALAEVPGEQDVSRQSGKAVPGFQKRLDYLPPLKRAVVMAEILKRSFARL
jgi:hypothetical protein